MLTRARIMKHAAIALFVATVTAVTAPPALAESRENAVAMVNYYAKYEARTQDRHDRNARIVEAQFAFFKEVDPRLEWVDVDIFLEAAKSERDTYKRIVIPYSTEWFTMEMYEGMQDYVRSGGLLITLSAGILVDENQNYRQDEGATTDFLQQSVLGVQAHGGATIQEVKVIDAESPLTRDLEADQWFTLQRGSGSRCTENINATVVMLSRQTCDGETVERPHLSYNAAGKGSCIYIAGSIYNIDDPIHAQIAANALSDESLAALCTQE